MIREEHGNYFCIGVAGFPEGNPFTSNSDKNTELKYLKEKVDSGADFILTQFFYEPIIFIDYVNDCKAIGINCPIIPG